MPVIHLLVVLLHIKTASKKQPSAIASHFHSMIKAAGLDIYIHKVFVLYLRALTGLLVIILWF